MDVLDLMNDTNRVGIAHDMNARPYVCTFEECDKAFARKSDLARHNRIHTGEKPYACLQPGCGKAFIQRSALTVHIRTHTGEKPHHCERCFKAFADSSSLARHRRTHTGTRPYSCYAPGCDRLFARKNTFLKHFVRNHPELPCPSTKNDRQPIQFALHRNREDTSVDCDGKHHYLTPVSISPPHGFAASQPPRSAAFSFTGGFDQQPTQPEFVGAGIGRRSERGQSRMARARPLQLASSPLQTPTAQSFDGSHNQPPNSAGLHTLHTPVSASSSFSHDGSFSGIESPPISFPDSGSFETPGDDPTLVGGSQGQSNALHVGHQVHSGFSQPIYRTFSGNSLPPPPPGMMWYKSTDTRSVSAPKPIRPTAPYVSAPFGNLAGFSANQLSIPPNHQSLLPSFYQLTPQPLLTLEPQSYDDDAMREGSPDLVDVRSVPTINVQQPATSPMPEPYTSDDSQFSTLTQGPPQFVMHMPVSGRLQSAPPFLNRFHTSPQVPTVSSWIDIEPFQGPGGYGDAHNSREGRSGEVGDWEHLEDQMISQEVSAGPEDETQSSEIRMPQQDGSVSQSLSEGMNNHWEAPIAFPQPPADQSERVCSSSASVASTSSTLVNMPPHQEVQCLSPLTIFPNQQMNQPIYTPMSGQQNFYATPITPWTTSMSNLKGFTPQPVYQQYTLQPPAIIHPPRSMQQQYHPEHSPFDQTYLEAQSITLATPPRFERTVSGVGLGLANVHFDDRKIDEGVEVERSNNDASLSDDGSEEEDYDFIEDDSDDEFVPGGRAKPKRRISNGKKKGRTGFTMRPRKRMASA